MKRVLRFAPLIVLLVFIGAALIYSESLKTRVRVGAAAPSFELPTLDGELVSLDDLRGKPVIVNFWAAWCPPCLEEMPAHDEFYQRYNDRVAYLAVNERETVARIQRHLNEVQEQGLTMTLPILLDQRGVVGDAFRLGGMPESWMIDPEGVARTQWIGPVTFEQLQAGYREATGESIDARDGGPFHGGGAARAVWAVSDSHGHVTEVYVGGESGLARYVVDNGGASASDFQWEPIDGETVLALTRTGNSRRPAVVTERGIPGLPAAPVAVAADAAGHQLAWVPQYGLYTRSDDGWQPVSADLPPQMPWAGLDADPFTPRRWLLAGANGLLESRDDGQTWRSPGVSVRSYAVRHDPVTPRRVYLATDTGVWVSEDGGRTAERIAGSPQRILVALDAVEARNGATVLTAVAPNGDVYTSTGVGADAGTDWTLLVPVRSARDS